MQIHVTKALEEKLQLLHVLLVKWTFKNASKCIRLTKIKLLKTGLTRPNYVAVARFTMHVYARLAMESLNIYNYSQTLNKAALIHIFFCFFRQIDKRV